MSEEEAEANDPEYAEGKRRRQRNRERRDELLEELTGLVGMDLNKAREDWLERMKAAA